MKFDGVKCDECNAIKKDTNHWFTAWAASGQFMIVAHPYRIPPDAPSEISLSPKPHLDLCSESCAAKAMSKAIGSGERPKYGPHST